jgi:hypothetical protein
MTMPDANLDRFIGRLRDRLIAGATVHSNVSFSRPTAELVDEVQEDLDDVCGWSLILWQKARAAPRTRRRRRRAWRGS